MGIIVFNNISSRDIGIEVETFPSYSSPEKEYTVSHVVGRNGDIVVDTKTYKNVPRTYSISVATYDKIEFYKKMNQVMEWLHSASGYARLEDSYESEFYRYAYFNRATVLNNILNGAGKADIEFTCKPQRYYKSGEIPILFTTSGQIQNEFINPAYPLLNIVTDNTYGNVTIGSHSFAINAESGTHITVDCELQDAYDGTVNKNNCIVLNGGEFPSIDPGLNDITFSGGIQSVEVIPRWWTV